MRILLVNKFHYLKGGSEKYYFELAELLKEHGHTVAFFSMKNEKNIKTGEKEYFVDEIDLNTGSKLKALDVIYSKKNKKKMEEALEDFKPDIVHLNNFQRQLSASIIKPIKKRKIPIVFTAHDLQIVCPNSAMLRKGKICEACSNSKYINCIRYKCTKNSTVKSILSVLEAKYYQTHKIYEQFDYIITPSNFVSDKIKEEKPRLTKIKTLYNFIDIKNYEKYEIENDNYALYSGRISEEKGIVNLLKAMKNVDEGVLHIAGEGPQNEEVKRIIKENNLENKIKLLGYLDKEKMKEQLRKCKFLVLPSIWYENCPFSVIEALAMGKPIVASKIGGIPELVEDGKNGYLYKYDSIDELTSSIDKMSKGTNYQELCANAKKIAENKFSKEKYYDELMKIYKEVIKKK